MFNDVVHSHEVNLERDWKVCSTRIGAQAPFADPWLTRFAPSLPLKYKLPAVGREPRKIVLRQLAKRLGLPDEIADKPKKAAQYSSGSGKIIEKLARKRGKTTEGYLAEMLRGVTSGE
jgi:asparagine synthase (glutamine-hydrolysing)